MRITKRQLKRIIKEMHPRAEVDNALFDYEEWARERGSPPGASSVIASYFISLGNWSAPDMRMLGDHYGISSEDIQREVSIQREEMAADGDFKYASMPPMQGPRTKGASPPRGMPDGRLGRLGESRTKVTKRQLRRIIREERARLLKEETTPSIETHGAPRMGAGMNPTQAQARLEEILTEIEDSSADDWSSKMAGEGLDMLYTMIGSPGFGKGA